jgi:hypothetical protein
VDILDLFADQPEEVFSGSFWLYGSTKGIIALGGSHSTAEAAQEALRAYAQEPLEFVGVEGKDLDYAGQVYNQNRNLAVVVQASERVIWEAALPLGWLPPGDPRRQS